MTDAVDFLSPSDADEGDPTKVRRSKDGRPYVKQPCPDAVGACRICGDTIDFDRGCDCAFSDCLNGCTCGCIDGRVAGKRPGTTKQCPKCKGKGYVEKLYSRCTSFVSVLDDRTQLEAWQKRVLLWGLKSDVSILADVDLKAVFDDDETKKHLNILADHAFEAGDGKVKAQKGTDLHTLTEYVDKGWPLPASLTDYETGQERPVTLQDRADLAAWLRVSDELKWLQIGSECFVVNDDYQIGGTYDRLVDLNWEDWASPCECGLPNILDLKTGRIDYGAGKIAQQLAVYAHSKDYDPVTGERTDQDVCTHVGIVVHLPQGTGEATVHVVDLEAGWAAVELSSKVREHRRMAKSMIWPLERHKELTS